MLVAASRCRGCGLTPFAGLFYTHRADSLLLCFQSNTRAETSKIPKTWGFKAAPELDEAHACSTQVSCRVAWTKANGLRKKVAWV